VEIKMKKGVLFRIAGPVVVAKGIKPRMYDVCRVGNENLMGEVIQIEGEKTRIQVYEDTSGIKPGEPVVDTGEPLKVELGPGMLGSIYDGIQRPLPVLVKQMGDFIKRGVDAPGLDYAKKWDFKATVRNGETVSAGQIIGEIEENPGIIHKVMVPPNQKGKIAEIKSGKFSVNDIIGKLDNGFELKLKHNWPVRIARPVITKLKPETPLITGQRIFDALFPLAKGGVAAIPGPFGAGKTVSQHQLAKWSDADIIVYVGCGERGKFYEENILLLKEKIKSVSSLEDYLDIREWIYSIAPPEDEKSKGADHVPGLLLQLSREPKQLPRLEIPKKPVNDLTYEDFKNFKLIGYEPHSGIKFGVAV